MSYKTAEYLIYNKWATSRANQSTIAGSLLLDFAMNLGEACEKQLMYKNRHDSFNKQFPSLSNNTVTEIIYIKNNSDWWTNQPA